MIKSQKVVSAAARKARAAFVENVKRRIRMNYPNISETAAFLRIGENTGLSLSTMQRLMEAKNAPTLDTVSDLARHFGCTVSELTVAPMLEPPDRKVSTIRKSQ